MFSACTSASLEPSYVLRAIGADEDLAHSSIRLVLLHLSGPHSCASRLLFVVLFLSFVSFLLWAKLDIHWLLSLRCAFTNVDTVQVTLLKRTLPSSP